MRIPAREIERLVSDQLAPLVADPLELAGHAWLDLRPDQIEPLHWRCKELEAQLHQRRSLALAIVQRVTVAPTDVTITCDAAALAAALNVDQLPDAPTTIALTCPARLTRSGRALRLVQSNGTIAQATPDQSLVRLLVRARQWWAILRAGEISPTELATREGVSRSYVARVVRLASSRLPSPRRSSPVGSALT